MRLERVRALTAEEIAALPPLTVSESAYVEEEEDELEEAIPEEAEPLAEQAAPEPREERHREHEPRPESEEPHGRRRRRRRRRGHRGDTEMREGQPLGEPREDRAFAAAHEFAAAEIATGEVTDPIIDQGGLEPSAGPQEDGAGRENGGDNQRKRRRRGRRGGRRRRRGGG